MRPSLLERLAHPLPGWRLIVFVVAGTGTIAFLCSLAVVVATGFSRPVTAGVGLVATIVVNRTYVVVSRRGQVREGIDIAEAPIVALALLMPPGEAVLTFVVASVLLELPMGRAWTKKIFNVGVRATGAGVLVAPLALVPVHLSPARYAAVAVGAVLYSVLTAVAVAAVIASVQQRTVLPILLDGVAARALVWLIAVATGMTSAYAALHAPAALLGILAPVLLVSRTAHVARRAQHESERLRHLLDASTRIQLTDGASEQEAVLLEVARELLLWKQVEVRDHAPTERERGSLLVRQGEHERWLVATRLEGSDPWSADDECVLETLAHAAALALDRARLQAELSRQALVDPLTGVANRRQFDETVARLCADGSPRYGLVLCDLDHFKSVNDRFGHDAGDDLLRIAAARLAGAVRAGDLVARLGGDEFVVLLPGVTSREAIESIRTKIAARFDEPVQVGRWHLSCLPSSFGVATAPRDGATAREVLRAADESMYDAKRLHARGPRRLAVVLPDRRGGEHDAEPRQIVLTGTDDRRPIPRRWR